MHILITSALVPTLDSPLLAPLRALGATFELSPFTAARAPGELAALLRDADAMIASSDPLPADVLVAAPKLRIIARTGVGYDAIDIAAARELGTVVTVTPGANEHAVADYTLAAMLALLRRVPENHAAVRAGGWARAIGTELAGKTVGVVGLGRIGKLVARRLAGFEPRLLAYDVVEDRAFAARYAVTYLPLDDLLAQADIVTLHVLLRPETHHLLDARRIGLLKSTAYLVNTCRGPVVDEAALAAALTEGRLAGAALDVFEQEPPTDSPILWAPNVLLSPHVAGVSLESQERMVAMAVEETARVLRGEPPLHAL